MDATTTAEIYAGVDVSKDRLDVCVRQGEAGRHHDDTFFVPHDDAGIDALVSRLVEERPVRVILEATGGFERAEVAALAAEGLPVAVVNPRQSRDFARATARLPRPIRSTPRSWHASPKPSILVPSPFRMKRFALCRGYSLGAGS